MIVMSRLDLGAKNIVYQSLPTAVRGLAKSGRNFLKIHLVLFIRRYDKAQWVFLAWIIRQGEKYFLLDIFLFFVYHEQLQGM
jgi:hypothetical protein